MLIMGTTRPSPFNCSRKPRHCPLPRERLTLLNNVRKGCRMVGSYQRPMKGEIGRSEVDVNVIRCWCGGCGESRWLWVRQLKLRRVYESGKDCLTRWGSQLGLFPKDSKKPSWSIQSERYASSWSNHTWNSTDELGSLNSAGRLRGSKTGDFHGSVGPSRVEEGMGWSRIRDFESRGRYKWVVGKVETEVSTEGLNGRWPAKSLPLWGESSFPFSYAVKPVSGSQRAANVKIELGVWGFFPVLASFWILLFVRLNVRAKWDKALGVVKQKRTWGRWVGDEEANTPKSLWLATSGNFEKSYKVIWTHKMHYEWLSALWTG